MPSLSHNMMSMWRNYHLTEEGRYIPRLDTDPDAVGTLSKGGYPDGTVRDLVTVNCSDLLGKAGPAMFEATSKILCALIDEVLDPPTLIIPKRPAVDLVPIGRGWSFSALVGGCDTQIDMTGQSGFAMARSTHMAKRAFYPARRTAFVLGGTRLRELLSWAQEKHNLSVQTSGTHLGLTIAGAIATASHGSRLGFGGMQDLVTGLHIVTGPKTSVWIERKSRPVLNDATINSFSNQPPIRDDQQFEDALVHLGGMGIVNGVTLEMVRDTGYALRIKRHLIDSVWLRDVAQGSFRKLAKTLGRDAAPIFYELTLDPFNWNGNPAVHSLYFRNQTAAFDAGLEPIKRTFADQIGPIYNGLLSGFLALNNPFAASKKEQEMISVFDLYCAELAKNPWFNNPPDNARWNQLHADEITGGYPGALYNASFAVPRKDIADVLPLLCKAVEDLLPTFLFTLRFVSNASGTLAFTRFAETCVIEIDGFSENAPVFGPQIGDVIREGARRVRACLDGENALGRSFDYSMHWGKLGNLDKSKVWADFGAPGTKGSKIDIWRATRAALLDPKFADILWNQALVNYGLIDAPRMPDPISSQEEEGSLEPGASPKGY